MIECVDIDECQFEPDVCPGPFDFCENKVGGFNCPCESKGFHRATENEDCSDVNECQLDQDVCPGPFDICENTIGGFGCPCVSQGFERVTESGNCSDVNECEEIPGREKCSYLL